MQTMVDKVGKVAEIWLSREDQANETVQQQVAQQCAQWRRRRYQVAVYRSGSEDLCSTTAALLAHNAQTAPRSGQDIQRRA